MDELPPKKPLTDEDIESMERISKEYRDLNEFDCPQRHYLGNWLDVEEYLYCCECHLRYYKF